jgi:hypothetical protein
MPALLNLRWHRIDKCSYVIKHFNLLCKTPRPTYNNVRAAVVNAVIVGLAPGSDPTIMSYNANIVKTSNTNRRIHTQYVIKTSRSSALILTKNVLGLHFGRFLPGPNPKIVSYNAMISLVCFENKNIVSTLKKTL